MNPRIFPLNKTKILQTSSTSNAQFIFYVSAWTTDLHGKEEAAQNKETYLSLFQLALNLRTSYDLIHQRSGLLQGMIITLDDKHTHANPALLQCAPQRGILLSKKRESR